ncbi:MAG TPA: ABC transporter permease [Ktedonobacteraceae bacterium]|nr:ABC transporter permease [Ktedonobacteraceae bacterium]
MNVISNESKKAVATSENTGLSSAIAARRRRRWVVNVLRVLILVVLIGGWELTTRVGIVDPFFWGRPSGILAQLVTWVTQGTAQGPLWEQIAATLEETVLGFLIGVVLGVFFGVLLGRNQSLADVLSPYIKVGNAIPRIVLGSIFVIALGLGMQSKIALGAVMVFFIVFYNAFQGVREVDRNLLANARILGASQRQLSTAVIIPSALTWIIASLHTSFSFALVGAVVGEYLGATQGIGLMIQTAQGTFNANGVFAAMVMLATLSLLAELLITALENRLIGWRPNTINDMAI